MNSTHYHSLVLAGDIGGTKTELGLFAPGKNRPRLKAAETFSSRTAAGLEDIVERFLHRHPVPVDTACFAIAGPVEKGRCRTTNLPWEVWESGIRERFGWRKVSLINDLEAAALSISLLRGRELLSLNKARAGMGGTTGLVAPGTGLGMALLVPLEGHYHALPSEGGHADFAPNNEDQVDLWRYLRERLGRVSVERVLSGPGLLNIYSWMKAEGRYREPEWLAGEMEKQDPAVITRAALKRGTPLCVAVVEMFVSILGAVAGNLALTGLTTGGVYLGGGIPPKILFALKEGPFMAAFTDKGRFRGLVERIPARVILNPRPALLGAARRALWS